MRLSFEANKQPLILQLNLQSQQQEIMVAVSDPIKPYTDYFKSSGIINGRGIPFFVRLPLTPNTAIVDVYNVQYGNKPYGVDKSFNLLSYELKPLTVDLSCFDSANQMVKSFLGFFIPFCERAGYLATSDTDVYTSEDGLFKLRYLDVIRDDDGSPLMSSARVDAETGIMDFSKYYFKDYTIAERILIGTHEFSHYFVNKNARDEFEADRNGLMMYLGMGFSRREALLGWLKVFGRAKSGQNARRYKEIEDFVMSFDSKIHNYCNFN